jgi:hypothetical protein
MSDRHAGNVTEPVHRADAFRRELQLVAGTSEPASAMERHFAALVLAA